MDNGVDLVFGKKCVEQYPIADVTMNETIVMIAFKGRQVSEIACVGKLVEVNDAAIGEGLQGQADKVGPDKAGTAGYQ